MEDEGRPAGGGGAALNVCHSNELMMPRSPARHRLLRMAEHQGGARCWPTADALSRGEKQLLASGGRGGVLKVKV